MSTNNPMHLDTFESREAHDTAYPPVPFTSRTMPYPIEHYDNSSCIRIEALEGLYRFTIPMDVLGQPGDNADTTVVTYTAGEKLTYTLDNYLLRMRINMNNELSEGLTPYSLQVSLDVRRNVIQDTIYWCSSDDLYWQDYLRENSWVASMFTAPDSYANLDNLGASVFASLFRSVLYSVWLAVAEDVIPYAQNLHLSRKSLFDPLVASDLSNAYSDYEVTLDLVARRKAAFEGLASENSRGGI